MLMLALTIVVFVVTQREPVVEAIDPSIVADGELVRILGAAFGEEGRIEVGGRAVPTDLVRSWADESILFEAPGEMASGLLTVTTTQGTSNALFLAARDDLPVVRESAPPLITGLPRDVVAIGATVTLEGRGFGIRRPGVALEIGPVVLNATSPWITAWHPDRIIFVVAPEVPEGSLRVSVLGADAPRTLTVAASGARMTLGVPQRFVLRRRVVLTALPSAMDETVTVSVPSPVVSTAQSIRELARSGPSVTSMSGTDRFEVAPGLFAEQASSSASASAEEDVPPQPVAVVSEFTWEVQRRSVRLEFDSAPLPIRVVLDPAFQRAFAPWLGDDDGVETSDATLSALALAEVNLSATPRAIALAVHRLVISRLEPAGADDEVAEGARAALESGSASASGYAALAVAVSRAIGLPARRVDGVILDDSGERLPHAWVETMVPGIGWVPSDPALADGMYGEAVAEARSFYDEGADGFFGALDSRRVAIAVDGPSAGARYPFGGTSVDPRSAHAGFHLVERATAGPLPDVNITVETESFQN